MYALCICMCLLYAVSCSELIDVLVSFANWTSKQMLDELPDCMMCLLRALSARRATCILMLIVSGAHNYQPKTCSSVLLRRCLDRSWHVEYASYVAVTLCKCPAWSRRHAAGTCLDVRCPLASSSLQFSEPLLAQRGAYRSLS